MLSIRSIYPYTYMNIQTDTEPVAPRVNCILESGTTTHNSLVDKEQLSSSCVCGRWNECLEG